MYDVFKNIVVGDYYILNASLKTKIRVLVKLKTS